MKQTNITHNIRVDKNKSNRAVKTGRLVTLIRNMYRSEILAWPCATESEVRKDDQCKGSKQYKLHK